MLLIVEIVVLTGAQTYRKSMGIKTRRKVQQCAFCSEPLSDSLTDVIPDLHTRSDTSHRLSCLVSSHIQKRT